MPLQATLPLSVVNVPNDYFYMAGFEVTLHGRFWVTTEEILDELPRLTKIERQEIRLRLAELDSEDWLDDEDPLTVHEKALLEARLAAYAKDPNAGSTWEEVEGRIRARLSRQPNG